MKRRPTKEARFVYFIEAGAGGPIKIGVADDVASRMRGLQGANPADLRLIVAIPGDHKIERELHRKFGRERLNGEWFNGNGEVRAFAEQLAAAAPDEQVAIAEKQRPEPKQKQKGKRLRGSVWTERKFTPKELHSMFYVGDDGSPFISKETEELLQEERRRRMAWGLKP